LHITTFLAALSDYGISSLLTVISNDYLAKWQEPGNCCFSDIKTSSFSLEKWLSIFVRHEIS